MAEKNSSLLFVIIGVAAIVLAAIFLLWFKPTVLKGAAWPLLVIGILQCIVGYTVHHRSDAQRKNIVYNMDMNPSALQQQEIPRMEKVVKNFSIYRYAEIVLLVAGVLAFLYFRKNEMQQLWAGVGLGLTLQALLLLAADGMAEKRAKQYLQGLHTFIKTS